MRAVPVNLGPFLVWSTERAQLWVDGSGSIGISAQEADEFASAAGELAAARDAEEAARRALVDATARRRELEASTRKRAALIIAQVRVFAERLEQTDPSAASAVYATAGIDPPREPRPLPAPDMPRLVSAELSGTTGHMLLRIAADQPRNSRGTMYQATRVWTDPDGKQRREDLPLTAARTLIDTNIPAGPREISYELRALRSGQASPPSMTSVRLAG